MSTESMFKHREININGQMQQLLWPAIDEGCLEIISLDWSEMNPIIVEHTPTRHTVVQAGGNCGLYPLLHSLQFERVFTQDEEETKQFIESLNYKLIYSKVGNSANYIYIPKERA